MPLASGTRLGPYQVVSQIGAGGMGEVHKASDTRLGRTVAINVPRPKPTTPRLSGLTIGSRRARFPDIQRAREVFDKTTARAPQR